MEQPHPKIFIIIPAKNEGLYIGQTLEALLFQSLKPAGIVVIDDGSTDHTVELVKEIFADYSHWNIKFKIIERSERINGINLVGQPKMAEVFNLGFEWVNQHDYDFVMINGSSIYPQKTYLKEMVKEFDNDPKLVIAGGNLQGRVFTVNSVTGSGRIYKQSFWKHIKKYALAYCWETEPIVTAWRLGFHARSFEHTKIHSLKKSRHTAQDYIHWGRGMRAIGYSIITAIFRSIVYMKDKGLKSGIQLLAGYFSLYWKYNKMDQKEKERIKKARQWLRWFQTISKAKKPFALINKFTNRFTKGIYQ